MYYSSGNYEALVRPRKRRSGSRAWQNGAA
jgi:hypothetical protein